VWAIQCARAEDGLGRGEKERAHVFAREEPRQHPRRTPRRDGPERARLRRSARRAELGHHAPLAARGGVLAHEGVDAAVVGGHHVDARPVGVEQPRRDGEHHQRVGVDEVGHLGRERVVVAEGDLVDGDRVVLVDDGDGAARREGVEGRAGVEVPLTVGEIGVREQHLGHHPAVSPEGLRPHPNQVPLARRGAGLELLHALRSARKTQLLHAQRDGPRRHHHHPTPRREGREVVGEARQHRAVEAALRVGQHAAANLHHHHAGVSQETRCCLSLRHHGRAVDTIVAVNLRCRCDCTLPSWPRS
jgi:hypothetical protein